MHASRESRFAVLRNRDFSRYLVARLAGTLAVQMQTVAVGWQVYEVTRDPLDLGLIGLSQFLPFVLLTSCRPATSPTAVTAAAS